jgi:hypothetical protein
MIPRLYFRLAFIISFFALSLCAHGGAKYGKHKAGLDAYPPMKDAIEALQSALKADDPLPLLQSAKKSVKRAKANEGGHKADAIQNIDDAIALLPGKNKDKIESKINAAIFYIHACMKKA